MRQNRSFFVFLLLVLVVSGLTSACRPPEERGEPDATAKASPAGEPTTMAGGASQLGDGEILAVLRTANLGEVEAGMLATDKATSTEVREFARQMVQDHSLANDRVDSVAGAAAAATENELSRELDQKADSQLENLQDLTGGDFDKAYVDGQVSAHRDVLRTIDERLLPSAQDEQIRRLLETVRQDVATHLEHAERLQEELGRVS